MDWPDITEGVFAISIAAQLSGLHPQTLRVYEREGLVVPSRSAGGTRRYSGQDVAKLREIAGLTATGVNIAGVKRILELMAQLRGLQEQLGQADAVTTR